MNIPQGWTYTNEGHLFRPCGKPASRKPDASGYLVIRIGDKESAILQRKAWEQEHGL